jgi:hypothetical protein
MRAAMRAAPWQVPGLWTCLPGTAALASKGKHFSKEFEAFALTLCREMPVKRASDILGESDQSLWRDA